MRRGSHDMQVNVAGIRRNIKNFAHNYSDAQKKVREATSNDPWGPSSTLMSEIADLTYNVVAFSEIMQMVWKRLNDHGRNWRHVYKALVLLEYLIKSGSEKVGQQCKENIFAIQTLKDFQHLEEGKDQGQNVREKAKQLVNLLKDDEKLKCERARALKAKERLAQSASGFGSDGGLDTPTSPRYPAFRGDWNSGTRDTTDLPRDIEISRPQTAGEEELQLQLALAMSREEAEQEEQKRKSDDVRLQLALSQSQQDFKESQKDKPGHMVDLLDVNLGDNVQVDPWGMPQPPRPQQSSPWHSGVVPSPPHTAPASALAAASSADPWEPVTAVSPRVDPWGARPATAGGPTPSPPPLPASRADPWSPTSHGGSSSDLDDFDVITNRNRLGTASPAVDQLAGLVVGATTNGSGSHGGASNGGPSGDPFELGMLGNGLPYVDPISSSSSAPGAGLSASTGATKKTPQSFLGENSALVNLDNLVTATKPTNSQAANPFADPQPVPPKQVFNTPPPKPSINEMKQASFAPFTSAGSYTSASATVPQQPGFTAPPYGFTGQFTATSQPFGSNGNLPASQPTQDPWAPAPSTTTASPWMQNEPANPFLS